MASIIIRTDGRAAKEVVLEKELTLIGQQDNADIIIEDPDGIDERAFILRVEDDFILDNLGSVDSALVNGQPVKKKILKDRDLIVIGHFRLTFQDNPGTDVLAGFAPPESGKKSHLLAYLVFAVAIAALGIAGVVAYVDSQTAGAQAAKANDGKRSESEERMYQNARAIGSAIKR